MLRAAVAQKQNPALSQVAGSCSSAVQYYPHIETTDLTSWDAAGTYWKNSR
jgi:hypothetical protein